MPWRVTACVPTQTFGHFPKGWLGRDTPIPRAYGVETIIPSGVSDAQTAAGRWHLGSVETIIPSGVSDAQTAAGRRHLGSIIKRVRLAHHRRGSFSVCPFLTMSPLVVATRDQPTSDRFRKVGLLTPCQLLYDGGNGKEAELLCPMPSPYLLRTTLELTHSKQISKTGITKVRYFIALLGQRICKRV